MNDENGGMKKKQEEYLEEILTWAEKLTKELGAFREEKGCNVHFRPSANGVSLVGLLPKSPQRGTPGRRDLKLLKTKFDSLFERHCTRPPGRKTPEKELQSYLISSSYQNNREMKPLNEASRQTDRPVELRFVTDEIVIQPVENEKKMVCDLLAVRRDNGGCNPVLLELKWNRSMKELVEQVETYSALVDTHRELFARLYSALLAENIRFSGKCEKWIVWPMAGEENDPREQQLRARDIRVVGYKKEGNDFTFRVGN